ncbi:hypothetical protein QWY13_00595 [Planococcus sp. N017]|uniref:Uncharacterized protein n=1 Tax=Planococcus shenhongbingii TaxID=3058398 RepID=A0ABT8N7W0_9BACL|nr:hypothetical protein [Planococcus sp. N017]
MNPVNQKKLIEIHADMVSQYFYGTSIDKPMAPKTVQKPVTKPAAKPVPKTKGGR